MRAVPWEMRWQWVIGAAIACAAMLLSCVEGASPERLPESRPRGLVQAPDASVLVNVGATFHGGVEALYTQGEAIAKPVTGCGEPVDWLWRSGGGAVTADGR